jgi:hypothetical protein
MLRGLPPVLVPRKPRVACEAVITMAGQLSTVGNQAKSRVCHAKCRRSPHALACNVALARPAKRRRCGARHRPAITAFRNGIRMAWTGIEGDSVIYFSFTSNGGLGAAAQCPGRGHEPRHVACGALTPGTSARRTQDCALRPARPSPPPRQPRSCPAARRGRARRRRPAPGRRHPSR